LFAKDGSTVGSIASVGGSDIKLVLSSDGDQYITGNAASNYMTFSAANAERMRITSAGNVGIGTSSPASKMTISSGVNTDTRTFLVDNAHSGGSMYNAFGVYVGGTDRMVTLSADYGDSIMAFRTNNSEAMRIDSSGNVDLYQGKNLTWRYAAGSTIRGSISIDSADNVTFSNGSSNTERMRIDTSGRVTMPYQPAFDVSYSSTGYTTLGTVVFNTVYTNVGGHYNTSNGRFTAPVSGSYIFYTSHIKDTNNTVSRRRFDKNSSQASNGRHLRLDVGQLYGDNGVLQAIIYCNAGDFVTVNQFAGTSYGSDNYDYFGGYLIG